MTSQKSKGSYYTPSIIAKFLVKHVFNKTVKTNLRVLEPSAGDGVFVKELLESKNILQKVGHIIAVEKEKVEARKIFHNYNNSKLTVLTSDFLNYQKYNNDKFDIVIGNPPYIKKNLLTSSQILECEDIHRIYSSLSRNKIKNIWSSFLVRSIKFLKEDGILAFVLPSELLQVKFALELRELILSKFERVEIFTFNELLFKECKGQDTVLLIGQKKSTEKGVYYTNIDKTENLNDNNFSLQHSVKSGSSKWTHNHLNIDEIELLENIKNRLKNIDYYSNSKAGIVTAANDYFIVNKNLVEKYSLQRFVKNIIQKGSFINGHVTIEKEEFENLVNNLKPTFLIALNKGSNIQEDELITKYLATGVHLQINKRYKTIKREKWYEVPNIAPPTEALFFKRCNEYPKMLKNSANLHVTDSAYYVSMKDNFCVNSLIYSFYNSLTLSFAELNGRYYGGGVLELTPNEFKNLPLPYTTIDKISFQKFTEDFKNKSSIKDICIENDLRILNNFDPNLNTEICEKIFNIREKLYLRRIKTN